MDSEIHPSPFRYYWGINKETWFSKSTFENFLICKNDRIEYMKRPKCEALVCRPFHLWIFPFHSSIFLYVSTVCFVRTRLSFLCWFYMDIIKGVLGDVELSLEANLQKAFFVTDGHIPTLFFFALRNRGSMSTASPCDANKWCISHCIGLGRQQHQ